MTAKTRTVSYWYVEGIKQGRAFLREHGPFNLDDIDKILANALACCRMTDAQNPVGQMHRGERDFWKGQRKASAP